MSDSIHVRMYNVGFGDCFLLTFPGKHAMLIDAGFHSQGKGKFGGNDLADQIVQDVKDITGQARIDIVVATHRHQDHVYAFNSKSWENVEVGEVWMPWVEDRDDQKAVSLWKKQPSFAMQLHAAIPTFGLDEATRGAVEFMLWNAGVELPGVMGAWSNKGALDCLHDGFARRDRARPRFLPEDGTFPSSFTTPLLPDVQIHVLGPPRDPALIEELDPEDDGETYRALALRAAAIGGAINVAGVLPPFGNDWQVQDDESGSTLDPDEAERLRALAQSADALLAAEKVDGMINSTSLVLVLQCGKARLLMTGDAEWGTWKGILGNRDARALLRGATFLKVGHHGSHNATSKTLVESVLPGGIPAMVSTQEGDGNYRNNIPLQDLLLAMAGKGMTYVRSDQATGSLPQGFQAEPSDKWVDLTLPC